MRNIFVLILLSLSFAAYNVGQTVSDSDQNMIKSTCYSGNGYNVDDDWSLADWNGATNGGNYNVIFMELSATW